MSTHYRNRRLFSSGGRTVYTWSDYTNEVRRLSEDHDTIVINTDGGCSNNGYSNAQASYGVFFGPDSTFNECGELPHDLRQTSQTAELYAAKMALETVLSMVYNYEGYQMGGFERVVLFSDSAWLINGITNWIWTWERNGYRNSSGRVVSNWQLWEELHNMILEIQGNGFEVCFMHVNRESNREADALARSVLY
ncbi:ribonuclease H-like protein [Mollisia scopiformis]|uniref:ribonuclease H n=1 Tax=Mollisia scopiformis TaxID=149040 RepID=A0A132B615_MOLSC|nr:ribonuclease H-like protein [Mollisia scopiformis]KUJ07781.1 ribonuclease H-like protein [Mollisia scopiformis]